MKQMQSLDKIEKDLYASSISRDRSGELGGLLCNGM